MKEDKNEQTFSDQYFHFSLFVVDWREI